MEKKIVSNGTLFILEKPFDPRSKWLFAFYCIAFFALLSWYSGKIFTMVDVTSILMLIIITNAYLIAGYKLANNASRLKTILVTSTSFEITEQCWFYKRKKKYDINRMSDLRFIERPVLTSHPLAGLSFDYLGFQTAQQVINEMYGDNRIAFNYNGETVSFGKNLYSWDFEEISSAVFPHQL
ncbi:MAG TPA: hypothetical protein VM101_01135 [Flavitalea sp.]|nr:hypothetical protein [Flavitalea sp.]